jgi:hypothetical protein
VNEPIPSDTEALRAALAAEQQARREAEARASGAEAMVAHLKLLIAKMKRDRFGASAERGRKLLDQLEMQLEELETAAAEDEAAAADAAPDKTPMPHRTKPSCVRSPAPGRFADLCRRICRVNGSCCRHRAVVPAVVASSPNSARPSPKPWRASRAPTK